MKKRKNIAFLLHDLLEDHFFHYRTTHGMNLCAFPNEPYYFSCPFSNREPVKYAPEFTLCREFASLDEFAQVLNIGSIADLNAMKPKDLMGYYEKGIVDIDFWLDNEAVFIHLQFSNRDGLTYITDQEQNETFISPAPLPTAHTVHTYTQQLLLTT